MFLQSFIFFNFWRAVSASPEPNLIPSPSSSILEPFLKPAPSSSLQGGLCSLSGFFVDNGGNEANVTQNADFSLDIISLTSMDESDDKDDS